jgi:hypothetical protein
MNIVFGDDVVEELRKKYTILELDTLPHPEKGLVTAYCVIPVEQIALEMAALEQNCALHEQVIQGIKANDTVLVKSLCETMQGKFGGELDTFYQEIIKRIDSTSSTSVVITQTIS